MRKKRLVLQQAACHFRFHCFCCKFKSHCQRQSPKCGRRHAIRHPLCWLSNTISCLKDMPLAIPVAPLFCMSLPFSGYDQSGVSGHFYWRAADLFILKPFGSVCNDCNCFYVFLHTHSQSRVHSNACIRCWPVLSGHMQGVAGCWCETKVTGPQRGRGSG